MIKKKPNKQKRKKQFAQVKKKWTQSCKYKSMSQLGQTKLLHSFSSNSHLIGRAGERFLAIFIYNLAGQGIILQVQIFTMIKS